MSTALHGMPSLATRFRPRMLSSVVGWWDANVPSSVTLDGNGNVSDWADLSGNGNTLTQSTANNRPAYTANAINGRPALSFDGVNDLLKKTFTLNQPETIFCVGNYQTNNGGAQLFDGNGTNYMRQYVPSSTELGIYADVILKGSVSAVKGWCVLECVFNSTSSSIRQNGASVASGNAGPTNGAGLTLAATGSGANWTQCQIAEVVIFSKTLTAGEAFAVRSYLGNKYGLTVT